MSIKKVMTVHDSKVAAFFVPFFVHTTPEAVRIFTDLANDVSHVFCKHAEDYTLFELGEYDETSGTFKLLETPLPIGKAIQFRRPF